MSTLYNAQQMAAEIERVIRNTREAVLAEERARVSRLIFLHGNTLADAKCGEAVLELLPFLYENADREEADRVTQS
jgi:hypothetical protein